MVLWAFKEFLPDWKGYFSILNKFQYIVLLGYISSSENFTCGSVHFQAKLWHKQ